MYFTLKSYSDVKMVTYSSFIVIALYIGMTLLTTYLVNKRYRTGGDFSTGGRQFNWFTAGVSILATYISAMTFVGMPGWVYSSGMEVLSIHLNYPIVIFFSLIYFVPVFYKLKLVSIYEYLEYRFGVIARTINSAVFVLVQCISAGVILYAVALIVIQILLINIYIAIVFISLFTAIYSYSGGISTVIWTDMLQSIVLIIGSVAILFFLLMHIDTIPLLERETLNIINTELNFTLDTTVWSGIVAASFLHLSVYGTNQLIIQRTLATKCEKSAQKSLLLCGYVTFFIYLFFSIIGLLLIVFYEGFHFTNSNEIILDFVFNHTNPIVIGIVISALVAAAMSTLDSTYNSVATVITFDFYKRFYCVGVSNEHYENIARKISLLVAIAVIIPAIFAISNESVLKAIASLTSIFVGIRLGSFLLGLFFNHANEKGLIAGSVFSIIIVLMINNYEIAWPWVSLIGTISFLSIGIIVSYFAGHQTKEQIKFIGKQKNLFIKPTMRHFGLLFFAAMTLVSCFIIPEWLYYFLLYK